MAGRFFSENIQTAALAVLTLCAAVLTTSSLLGRNKAPASRYQSTVEDWKAYAVGGHSMGASAAPVTIVEFSDFQCPYCSAMAQTLRGIRSLHGASVRVVYRHYPLGAVHARAEDAALASECASDQAQFEAYHDTLFAWQASLDTVDFGAVARSVGVSNQKAFVACLADRRHVGRVRADVEAGERLQIRGTPTMLVNSTKIDGVVDFQRLDSIVRVQLRSVGRR